VAEDDFGAYYAETYRRVWGYLLRLTKDRTIASELAQESFVRLISAKREGLPVAERTAYLFTIATNLARDLGRRTKREREAWAAIDSPKETADPSRRLALERALASMPERERSIIWLAYAEGFDHRSIAGVLGVGEASVKVLLFRAKQKLIALLGGRNE
jgi:RNA polymerase sigma-70 factor (ECF subfamily)